jgi:hypothetical protein
MENKYYVYTHLNPQTNEIFYVGLGYGQRAWVMKGRNRFWINYVNKHGKPIIKIYKKNLNRQKAALIEIKLIKKFGRRIKNQGLLVNICDGGEGNTGYKHTEEWKINHSKTQTGKKLGPLSYEAKQKISISLKGKERPNQMTPVLQYTLKGEFIKEFKSIKEAELETGIKSIFENASGYKNNRVKTAGGFVWIYKCKINQLQIKLKIANSPKRPTPLDSRKKISKNLKKPIIQYNMNNEIIKEWDSIKTASEYYNIHSSSIGNSCRNKQKTSCGFIWKFKN